MTYWIACNKDESLHLFLDKPWKNEKTGEWADGYLPHPIDSGLIQFCHIRWEDKEPREVEINLI